MQRFFLEIRKIQFKKNRQYTVSLALSKLLVFPSVHWANNNWLDAKWSENKKTKGFGCHKKIYNFFENTKNSISEKHTRNTTSIKQPFIIFRWLDANWSHNKNIKEIVVIKNLERLKIFQILTFILINSRPDLLKARIKFFYPYFDEKQNNPTDKIKAEII